MNTEPSGNHMALAPAGITEESLVSSVLILFPQCREVLQRHGGLRDTDGRFGPEEPVSWFARRREVPLEQLLRELNDAARRGGAAGRACAYDACRCQARGMEIFLRYGFTPTDLPASGDTAEFPVENSPEQTACTRGIWDQLAGCRDPRYPEDSIVDLGFVEEVRCDPRHGLAEVRLVLSSTDATLIKRIVDQIRERVSQIPTVRDVRVRIVGFRPLRPERMKPEVRQRLGLDW